MKHSWGSMLRTVRAAVAVMLFGGIGLTVPPQTRDMLAFLEDAGIWPAISFPIALAVLAGSAWFWSRAALAARFGIDDWQRYGAAPAEFNWTAFTWLPRLMLVGSFLVGVVIAFINRSPWSIAGAIALGVLGLVLLMVRPSGTAGHSPASGPLLVPRLVARRSQGAAQGALATGAVRRGSGVDSAGVWLGAASARGDRVVHLYAASAQPSCSGISRPRHCRASARSDDRAARRGDLRLRRADAPVAGRVTSAGLPSTAGAECDRHLRLCGSTTAVSHPHGPSDRQRACCTPAARQTLSTNGSGAVHPTTARCSRS